MDWPIFFTVLGSAFAVIGCVYQFLRNFKCDINSHIDRLDSNLERANNRLDGHAQRIDQLYKMFVDSNDNLNKRWDEVITRIDKKLG